MSDPTYDVKRAEAIRTIVQRAFESHDLRPLNEFVHPDDDSDNSWTIEQAEREYQRVETKLKPYRQPAWGIFKTNEYYPAPVFSIDVELIFKDETRQERTRENDSLVAAQEHVQGTAVAPGMTHGPLPHNIRCSGPAPSLLVVQAIEPFGRPGH